ncbi:TonB-dependent receptor [Costertonia aggregata]|uniref:TonB-dependent receptor n=1 Tax=Costertonia aggregata TaxID=343403 RepID=A0A7H9AS68_9FLAO|nr:TonB-dependent receptor [Costertonia aggregata]QLG46290.1 TonB-dependent receptor [Costertonia aggregata]
MKNFSVAIMALLFSIVALGQTTIEGTISDGENIPLLGATIMLNNTRGTTSDMDGKYSFANVESGQYSLTVSYIGYKSETKSVEVSGQANLSVDFTLVPATEQLQPVEIIGRRETGYKNTVSYAATKSAAPVKEVPTTINFVTKELALDQAAFTLNDVIKNISGVNQFSFYNDITIRGFRVAGQRNSGNLVNGMRAFTSFWKPQLIPHIERVEVIKGPASALFGNASPGGTINRVTKKPLPEARQSITASVGSFNTFRTLADFTGPMTKDNKLLYRLNLGYENTDGFRDLQLARNLVVAPSFSFLPTNNTRLNFDIVYQDSQGRLDRGQAVFGNGDLFSTPITKSLSAANDFLDEISLTATVSLQHNFIDNITFNSIFMRSSYDEDLLEHRTSNRFAALGDGSFDEEKVAMRVFIRKRGWDNNNFNNYFNFDFDLGRVKNKLLVGYDYFQQELQPGGSQLEARSYLLQNGTATNVFDPDNAANYVLDGDGNPVTNVGHFDLVSSTANGLRDMSNYVYRTRTFNQFLQRSHGVYLQNQAEIGDFKVLVGLRQEYFTDFTDYNSEDEEKVEQQAFLPRIGLVYTMNDNINLYGTWVQGFQPQSAADIINPDAGGPFDPLESELFEFGAKSDWFNGRLNASLSLYLLTQKGELYNADDPNNPERLVQIGEEEAKGFELDISGNITQNWSLVAGYAFNDAKFTESDDPAEIGRQKPNAPRHMGNIWSKYILGEGRYKGVGFGVGYNFVSERFGSIVSSGAEPTEFPMYGLFDAALYYNLNKVQIQLNINNIFNKTHWVGGYDFIRAFPGAPRNVMTTVSYTF